jgi:hypothetical protein
MESRTSGIERWATLALERKWVARWVEGAIFPTEMVFFLATCEALGIGYIIESGRQDGYSSQILGEFARRTSVHVASIDYEEDKQRGRRCRERLAEYPIDLRVGNAFELLGAMVDEAGPAPIALLIDGPKGFGALSLAAAVAADPRILLLAMHNLDPGTGYRRILESVSGRPVFYEEALVNPGGAWRRLREVEHEHCMKIAARRSLDHSTLGVVQIGEAERAALRGLWGTAFKFYQPPLVRLGIQLKLYRQAASLFRLSFRVFGS